MVSGQPLAPCAGRERLGAYELLLELASGGMATVHLARATDKRQGPPLVALKLPHRHLQSDKTFLTMLVDEAHLASSIDHPNVVKVRELGFDGGLPFIVMDYIEGASLAELRRELSSIGRALDVRVAVRIIVDALLGLHAAHELKDDNGKALHIIHRDVSPQNVLVACDGRAYVTDFGIAKAEDRIQTTRTCEVKGKLAYLAPERVDKRRICSVQSDVFSTAVVLWECFAGRRLFRGEEAVDILQEVMSAPIPTLRQIGAQIPQPVDNVIARALSRDLETRHRTALELAEDLERAAGPEHIGTHADVARLMEAIFGGRMALWQERVCDAIGPGELTSLLRDSGLPARDRVSFAGVPPPQLLAELAPPAPTSRYAIGTELPAEVAKLRTRRLPWWAIGAMVGGIVLGATLTLTVARRPHPGPIVILGTPPAAAARTVHEPTPRKVLVTLPFLSTHVQFDAASRELNPATDVVAFDVPPESGPRHKVTVTALDGTRAEGVVREQEGMTQPEPPGYSFIPAAPADPSPPRMSEDLARPTSRSLRPVGTVHDGFTKLP